jgi:GDP-4-dehydro-6-deoxy-D-mannose reductase
MLILGAGGFVGSHLRQTAVAAGARVIAPDRRQGEDARACDLRDPASLEACLEATEPDLIVNAAGVASVKESLERPGLAWETNALGARNLLEAVARKTPEASMVFLSSAEVYGDRATTSLLGEDLDPDPVTPYGTGKLAMEAFCGEFSRALGIRIAVFRAFNLIGPGQREKFVASGFAKRIALAERDGEEGVELGLGNPGAVRDFTDVRDAARILLEASQRRIGGIFNLCSGRPTSITGLVEELDRLTPLEVRSRRRDDLARPTDPSSLVGDPRKMHEATGLEAATPLSRSLGDLLDWWRAQYPPA